MLREGGPGDPAPRSRIESVGLEQPETELTTDELLARTRHHPRIDLERLTGIHSRRVCAEGEDSFTLAVAAARDCLARSSHSAADVDMVINASISRNRGGLFHELEPPFSVRIREAIGATRALPLDISNACAGMMTGVFILNDFIRRRAIRCGMVVSGESISNLGTNAGKQIRWVLSRQLASLTLGDAGAAVIVDRAPEGESGIELAAFTTLSDHSRLCMGFPSKVGPGATMLTQARTIHRVAIEEAPSLLAQVMQDAGLDFDDIDYVIPHQTSSRAIRKGTAEISERLGMRMRNVVDNVTHNGNTSSTTHFVALHQYLSAGRLREQDRVLLLSFASGLEVGVVIFTVGDLVSRHGNCH